MKVRFLFFLFYFFITLSPCFGSHLDERYGYRYVIFDKTTISEEQRQGIGVDDNPILNDKEVAYLNELYDISREDTVSFDFSGKKVAFLAAGSTVVGKKKFFDEYFQRKRPVISGIVIFKLSERKKKKIEGYDVAVVWYDKPAFLFSSKSNYKSLRSYLKHMKKKAKKGHTKLAQLVVVGE